MTTSLSMKAALVLSLFFAVAVASTQAAFLGLSRNCSVGGLRPNLLCRPGLQCVLYDEGNIPVDVPASGICRIPNGNTCFDEVRGLYFFPGSKISGACGSCKCSATGGQIQCPRCVPAGGACYVGGNIRSLPCQMGYTCVLDKPSTHPDMASSGVCKKPTSNTCLDVAANLYLAPNITFQRTGCGLCTCPAKGGKLRCSLCVVAGGRCSVGGMILPQPLPCQPGLSCVFNSIATLPDMASTGFCKIPNHNTCAYAGGQSYLAPNASLPRSDCGRCKCSATGGQLKCEECVLEGGKCTVGGRFAGGPPLGCQAGTKCVLYDEGLIAADRPAYGNCQTPNNDTCYDAAKQLYFAPNAVLSNDCGPCKCPPRGGKIECAACVPAGARCHVGGNIRPRPCQAGYQCVVDKPSTRPDVASSGVCKKPNRDTCFDKTTRLRLAPNVTVQLTDCGPCTCSARGGKLVCKSCVRAGGRCSVDGFVITKPLPCQPGYPCVLSSVSIVPDIPSTGICKMPNEETCFDAGSRAYYAPRTKLPRTECGPCMCPDSGGQLQCEKCVLAGGNCSVGGRFVGGPPRGCQAGSQCVLYDEGFVAADVPARGNCQTPTKNTCYYAAKELYYVPNATLSNDCGKCKCAATGGKVTCKVNIANCFVDPCLRKTCPRHPLAECQANYCGGCNFKFYLHGVPVTC